MATATRSIGYRCGGASQWQRGLLLSRDPIYLLGLMDSIDSNNSDNNFDGYLDDDSMQSTTEIQDDTCTHMLDEGNNM